jgi:predicted phosphodiesterase
MKVFVIPDIHQTDVWVKAAEENISKVDKMIFLGDYVDSFHANELRGTELDGPHTIRRLKAFYDAHPDKVVLLCGNHDFSYLAQSSDGQRVSGHQPDAAGITEALLEALQALHAVVEVDGVVYSHAGVSKIWYENHSISSLEQMDDLLHHRSEKTYNWDGMYDGYGDEPQQTPFWIRPQKLIYSTLGAKDTFNMQFPKQVVGHTEMRDGHYPFLFSNKTGIETTNIMPDNSWLCVTDSQNRDGFITVEDGEITTPYKTI